MKKTTLNRKALKGLIFVILGAFIACVSSFINGYPFIYPDTASYIYSGFNGLVFDDRPIFYGLFLRHVSLHEFPWLVVLCQSIILSYTIYLTIGMFIKTIYKNYVFMGVIVVVSACTAFSFVAGILTPDVFTPITLLCFVNLTANKTLTRSSVAALSFFFVLGICTQISSLIVFFFVFLLTTLYVLIHRSQRTKMKIYIKRLTLVCCLWMSCFFIIPGVHALFSGRFILSGAGHVFIMNHFLETGVLSDYLNQRCPQANYKICDYKDKLDWNFIWSEDSPVKKTGGWAANKEEYNAIIADILTEPEYLARLSAKAVEYTFRQFFTFNAEVSPPQLEGSQVFVQVGWRFNQTKEAYTASVQNTKGWNLTWLNRLQKGVVFLSLGIILVFLLNKKLSKFSDIKLKRCICFCLLFMLVSCFVCSNLSTIDARFQSRLIWLLPFFATLITLKYGKAILIFSAGAKLQN